MVIWFIDMKIWNFNNNEGSEKKDESRLPKN